MEPELPDGNESPSPQPAPSLEDSIKERLPRMPGFKGLPIRLLERLMPGVWRKDIDKAYGTEEVILCLYAGNDDDTSTKAAFKQEAPHLLEFILELELERKLPYHDVLDDRNFQELFLLPDRLSFPKYV